MTALFESGRIADLLLLFTVIEAASLAIHRRRTGRGLKSADLVGMLLPGVFLMVALRFALVGTWWGWIALSLVAALFAHLFDLMRRWHPQPSPPASRLSPPTRRS